MINRIPYRVQPRMAEQAYRTFRVEMPRATHWRPGSCEEAGCSRWAKGWKTTFTSGTPEGERIRHAIKTSPIRRKYTVARLPEGRVEVLFEAGQPCFLQDHPTTQHRVPLDRPQIHVVRSGDWRTDAGTRRATRRVHTRAEHWIEEFAENQDRLASIIERG